jgi:hypothetical protein
MTPEQRAAAMRLADALDADDFDIMHDAATILRELAVGDQHLRRLLENDRLPTSSRALYTADQMREYAEHAVAAERERCAQMVAGKPFVDTGGAQARRGPSSVGTWHERSPCGNLMSAMAEALRKHGITG